MELLNHQLKSVERIVARCQKQNGIVLYHELGTGKTLTSLTIIMNYKMNKSVIFCPPQFKYVWINEMKKIDYDFTTEILTHKDIYSHDCKDKIVIIDEAHDIMDVKLLQKSQDSKKIILLSGIPIYNDISDLSLLVNIAAGKQIITYDKMEFHKKYMTISKVNSLLYGYLLPIFQSNIFKLGIKVSILRELPQLFFKMLMANDMIYYPELNASEEAWEWNNLIHDMMRYNNIHLDWRVKPTQGFSKDIIRHLSLPAALILLKMMTNVVKKYELQSLYKMDFQKFAKDISPYIDYYKPGINSDFPSKKMETKFVEYNALQIQEWLKITYNINTKNKFVDITLDDYLDMGRAIGNSRFNHVEPPKFIRIVEFIKKHHGNHLIYTNFHDHGGLLLSEFFTRNKIEHTILQPVMKKSGIERILHDFKVGKVKVLILHKKYTLPISGTKYFHIIEPILKSSKYDQIIGRALRNDSHSHLPKNEREVTVINWICTNQSFKNGVLSRLKELKIWKDNFRQVYIDKFKESKSITDPLTPDQIVFNANNELNVTKEKLQAILEKQTYPCASGETTVKCKVTTPLKKGNC